MATQVLNRISNAKLERRGKYIQTKWRWFTVGYATNERDMDFNDMIVLAEFQNEGDAQGFAKDLAVRPEATEWFAVVVR